MPLNHHRFAVQSGAPSGPIPRFEQAAPDRAIGTTGFLNIALGGVGRDAAEVFFARYQGDGEPFPQVIAQIDTEPTRARCVNDRLACLINLNAGKVEAMQADPERFPWEVGVILEHMQKYLSPHTISKGSRTTRCLTQLSVAFHETDVALMLRSAFHALLHRGGVSEVIPVFFSSSGGGAGSALQILLARLLQRPAFKLMITEGFHDDMLLPPICVVAEPFALAQTHSERHHSRIMGNAKAFRIESAEVEKQHATMYIMHIGMSNNHGTILADPLELSLVLGTGLYEYERAFARFIKPRNVDTVDPEAMDEHNYLGRDLPEILFPGRINGDSETV